jgi:hypothetical protein
VAESTALPAGRASGATENFYAFPGPRCIVGSWTFKREVKMYEHLMDVSEESIMA